MTDASGHDKSSSSFELDCNNPEIFVYSTSKTRTVVVIRTTTHKTVVMAWYGAHQEVKGGEYCSLLCEESESIMSSYSTVAASEWKNEGSKVHVDNSLYLPNVLESSSLGGTIDL